MSRLPIALLMGFVLLAGAAGCGDDYEQIPAEESGAAAPEPPPLHGGGKLQFLVPTGWKVAPNPDNRFRYATLQIPLAEGDTGTAELTISYQGSPMGTTRMNLERWASSILDEDGKPKTLEGAAIDQREINGLMITTLDLAGEYRSTMGGGHGNARQSAARLFCAIVETPDNAPYYVKVLGPAKTMTAAEDDYEKFLTSLRLK